MPGLLTKYNRSLRKQMHGEDGAYMAVPDPLERYCMAKEDNDLLEVVFNYADKEGNLHMKDENGVEVRILYEDILSALPYYNAYIKDRFIGTAFVARVKSIDTVNNIVTVESARSNAKATKTRIISEIQRALSGGQTPRVIGRVVRVTRDRVYVNILCKEIMGICSIKYWRKGYVQDLHAEVKEGELLEFEITGEMTPRKTASFRRKSYLLSRVNLTADPWERIPEELTEGSAIIIKCVERPGGKPYWWGSSDLAPGVSIMCDYNKKVTSIREGMYYKCKVFRLNREERKFQATPIEETSQGFDPATYNNLKVIENRSKS